MVLICATSLVMTCIAREPSRKTFMPPTKKIQHPANPTKTTENNAITVKQNSQTGFWEQLTTQRKEEQDLQLRAPIPSFVPFFGGKQFQTNITQVANLAGFPGLVGSSMLLATYKESIGLNSQTAFLIAAWTLTIKSLYGYSTGQKIPFKIVESQKSSTPENKTKEGKPNK